jgi:hypothetical protein
MAKAKKKKSALKPTPGMLGSGGAARTGRLLQNRQAQLDAQIDAQVNAAPKSVEVNDSDSKKKKRY